MVETSKTLEQLEGESWGKPLFSTSLIKTIHNLRHKPISEFTIEDLRITLGQKCGVEHLAPLALDQLETDPFSEGDFYPGDLLRAVMDLPGRYWLTHPDEAVRMRAIAGRAEELLDTLDEIAQVKTELRSLLNAQPWNAS